MKLPYIRASQLTKEQFDYLSDIANIIYSSSDKDAFIVDDTDSLVCIPDWLIHKPNQYLVNSYEEFITKYEQIKLMRML